MANPKRYSEKIKRKDDQNKSGLQIPSGSYNMMQNISIIKPLFEPHFKSIFHNNPRAEIHAKLEISHPQDESEMQADEMADSFMRGDADHSQQILSRHTNEVSRKGEGGGMETSNEFDQQLNNTKGQGQKLDESTKGELEQHTGTDLSGVNIHTNSQAHDMSESINAKAFAHGQDIYFKSGNYNPQSEEGKSLLAHEVAHTVQQSGETMRKIQRQPDDGDWQKAFEYVEELRANKRPTLAPDAGEKAILALRFNSESTLFLSPEDIGLIIHELSLIDPLPLGTAAYLGLILINASDDDLKKIVDSSLMTGQQIDSMIGSGSQVVDRLLKKENEKRLAKLKSVPDHAKVLAGVTLAEGASAEEQDINVEGGLKEIAWVYKNRIQKDGFMKGLQPSNAFYDKKKGGADYHHMQAHCRSWMEYFGVVDPNVTALYKATAKQYDEKKKKIALDVLEFVARDVWQTTSESVLTNPIAGFYGQGFYLDMNYDTEPWIYARKFLYLWLKALTQANNNNTNIDYLNDKNIVKDTSFITEAKFDTMMRIVGGVGVRSFLYNADKIKEYLSSIPNSSTGTKTELPLPEPTKYQIDNNIFPANQTPDPVPTLEINNSAWEPKPNSYVEYKIDQKSVKVDDDLTLIDIQVDGKPVKVVGTQLHEYDGKSVYNAPKMATAGGKSIFSSCKLFADGKEVLMPGDPRVTNVQNANASLMVYKGTLYYDQIGLRLESTKVASLNIEGMAIPDTK